MRRYKHWLKINGKWNNKRMQKAYFNLKEYIDTYPESKITVYNPTNGFMFNKFFCLECNQSYNSLDLDCNSSFDGSLIHLNRKPNNIKQSKKDFDSIYEIFTRARVI